MTVCKTVLARVGKFNTYVGYHYKNNKEDNMSKEVKYWSYKGQNIKINQGKDINSTTYTCSLTVPKMIITFNTFSRRVMRLHIDKYIK